MNKTLKTFFRSAVGTGDASEAMLMFSEGKGPVRM
jgi:hypothetical protein